MTPDFECVQMDDSLCDIPKIMHDGKFSHIPVVKDHEVVGILSSSEVGIDLGLITTAMTSQGGIQTPKVGDKNYSCQDKKLQKRRY
jgi:predicted transcriptional regulator